MTAAGGPWWYLAGAVVVVLVALAGWSLGRSAGPRRAGGLPTGTIARGTIPTGRPAVAGPAARPGRHAPAVPSPSVPHPAAGSSPESDRRALVLLCVEVADRLRDENPALHSRLRRGLGEVGVVAVEPDGEVFDRSRHDAVGREPAPTSDADRRVASTEVAGYVDRGVVVRRPEVVVYEREGVGDAR